MPPTIRHRNGKLYLDNAPLLSEAVEFSYLAEAGDIGDAQIFLEDYAGFADNQALLIEDLGSESAEIVTVNGTPSRGGGAVLDSALTLAHPLGAKVYVLDYNQVELSHATTSTGSKTTLTTSLGNGLVAIQPDQSVQVYNESEYSSGYYFARYKHSLSAVFSDYSDPLAFGGWDRNTVGFMIDRALHDLSETLSEKVTRFDCYEWINECLKFDQGKLKRWPEYYAYNAILGQVSRGSNVLAMPTDAYDQETNKSLIALRLGDNKKLTYLDPVLFDNQMTGVRVTQVRTQALSGDTSLAVDNSYDFDDSGTVDVYISGTKYAVTYTGVTRSATAGVLTGVPASGTGAITVTIPVDTYLWQDEVEGVPEFFTVRNSNIEFWPLADANNDNQNVYGDYSKVATMVDSDGDTIDAQRYDRVQNYLTWRIKMKARGGGTLDQNDAYYLLYKEKLNDAIRTLPQNIVFRRAPRINRINKRASWRGKADMQDLAVGEQ